MTSYGEDSRSAHLSFHFLKGRERLGLQQLKFLALIQARGTHINVKKNSESENFMSGDL